MAREFEGTGPSVKRDTLMPEREAMKIKVLLFGLLKDIAGRSSETLELQDGAVVRDVLA